MIFSSRAVPLVLIQMVPIMLSAHMTVLLSQAMFMNLAKSSDTWSPTNQSHLLILIPQSPEFIGKRAATSASLTLPYATSRPTRPNFSLSYAVSGPVTGASLFKGTSALWGSSLRAKRAR